MSGDWDDGYRLRVGATGGGAVDSVDGQTGAVDLSTVYQPLDGDLTAIAALTTTAAGRSALTITDPNADRVLAWDDTAGAVAPIALADITAEASPATGDYLLVYRAEGDLVKVNWSSLPGVGGGISNVVEDLTPQLGGDLDPNGFGPSGNWVPNANNTYALGSTAEMWADLFLGSGAVINWNNGVYTSSEGLGIMTHLSDIDDSYHTKWTSTRGANATQTFGIYMGVNGTSVGTETNNRLGFFTNNGTVAVQLGTDNNWKPEGNDGSALGTTALNWSDLFLASGAVINFDNGNVTLTHSAGVLTANGAFSIGTGNALTAGTIELGAASDTTLSRSAAGVLAVEGVPILKATSGVGNTPTSSTTTAITHGLGRTPVIIRIYGKSGFTSNASATPTTSSDGVWTSSGNTCIYQSINGTTTIAAQTSTTFSVFLDTSVGNTISGVIQNVGATTFDIVWTETGTHTRGVYMWEAQ